MKMFCNFFAKPNFGLLLLRILLGAMMVMHGVPKFLGGSALLTEIGQKMAVLGITFAPLFWGFCAALLETLGGVLLVLGFLCQVTAIWKRDRRLIMVSGFLAICMAGFSINLLPFVLISLLSIVLLYGQGMAEKISGVKAWIAGCIPAGVLWIACWLPHPLRCLEQFLWFLGRSSIPPSRRLEKFITFATGQYPERCLWLLSLIILTAALLPLAWTSYRRWRKTGTTSLPGLLLLACLVYCFCAALMYIKSHQYQYLLIYMTLWPLLGCIAAWHHPALRGAYRKFILILMIASLPGWFVHVYWHAHLSLEHSKPEQHLSSAYIHNLIDQHIPPEDLIYMDSCLYIEQRAYMDRSSLLPADFNAWSPDFLPCWIVTSDKKLDEMSSEKRARYTEVARYSFLPNTNQDATLIFLYANTHQD